MGSSRLARCAATDVTETGPGHESVALPLATLAIWRTSSGDLVTPPRELDVGNGPGGSDVLAFSRDGKLLAVSLLHAGALVIDAATGETRRRLSDPGDDIISLAFAPDGTLATGTLAGTVDLWNPRSGARLAPSLLAASAPIASIAFASDGERFATSGYQDGTVKLWSTPTLQQEGPDLNTDPGAAAWEQRACAVAGRDLSRQEWGRLVSELPYATVCR